MVGIEVLRVELEWNYTCTIGVNGQRVNCDKANEWNRMVC